MSQRQHWEHTKEATARPSRKRQCQPTITHGKPNHLKGGGMGCLAPSTDEASPVPPPKPDARFSGKRRNETVIFDRAIQGGEEIRGRKGYTPTDPDALRKRKVERPQKITDRPIRTLKHDPNIETGDFAPDSPQGPRKERETLRDARKKGPVNESLRYEFIGPQSRHVRKTPKLIEEQKELSTVPWDTHEIHLEHDKRVYQQTKHLYDRREPWDAQSATSKSTIGSNISIHSRTVKEYALVPPFWTEEVQGRVAPYGTQSRVRTQVQTPTASSTPASQTPYAHRN